MPPLATGYVRVSTVAQVEDGQGLAVQRDRIAAWCAYQGVDLAEVYEDAGVSGSIGVDGRDGLRAALRAVLERGPDAVLCVYRLDRLGRSAIDTQETIALLLDAGVRVVSIADGVDSASGMGAALLKLLTSILATFAEMEKEAIRTRLLDGRRRADADDRVYGSEPRYGRRVADPDEGTLVVDLDEARAVARIHELRDEGLTFRQIASRLDAEGFRPRRAASWNHVVVGRIATGRRTPKRTATGKRLARLRAELLGAPDDGDETCRRRERRSTTQNRSIISSRVPSVAGKGSSLERSQAIGCVAS